MNGARRVKKNQINISRQNFNVYRFFSHRGFLTNILDIQYLSRKLIGHYPSCFTREVNIMYNVHNILHYYIHLAICIKTSHPNEIHDQFHEICLRCTTIFSTHALKLQSHCIRQYHCIMEM